MARRVAALLFCLFFLLMSREPPWGDARITFETARALIDRGSLDLQLDAPSYFFTVYAGKKYGFATLGNVLASLPSLLLYRVLSLGSAQPQPALYALCCHVSSALLMALSCGLFLRLCRMRGARPRLAVLLTLGLGLSTICFCYARSPYSEALQTFALLWLFERSLVQAQPQRMTRVGMASLGAAAGIVLNAKLVYAAVLPLCALYVAGLLLRATRRSPLPAEEAASMPPLSLSRVVAGLSVALLAFLPFVALVLVHNYIKTGSPFRTGYWGDLFSGQLWPSLYGYTLSSGQSIFLYSPPLLLALLGLRSAICDRDVSRRLQTALLLSLIAVVTLLNAKYFLWHGAFCWGPRLMVPLTPLILLLCLPWLDTALQQGILWLRRAALGVLLLAGAVVQLLGASLYWDHFLRIAQTVRDALGGPVWSPDYLPHVYFIPQFAPLRGYPWLLSHMLRRDPNLSADAPWRTLFAHPIDVSSHFGRLRLDFWILDWGSHPVLATAIVCSLLVAAALCLRSLHAALRDADRI
ncbi:MAG: hypothetical protein JNJ46_17330 [Myxococcales bacterium]|nr:hypothetical protein [Myxococcales bacterium]